MVMRRAVTGLRGSTCSSEQGMALMSVILVLMMVSGLCAALAISGNTETLIARNHQVAAEARAAAEAGLSHAVEVVIAELQDWETDGLASASAAISGLLDGPDNQTGTTADNGSLEALGIPRPPARRSLAGLPGITYEARVFDDDDPDPARDVTLSADDRIRIGEISGQSVIDENTRIVVWARGYASGNAVATVEAIVGPVKLPAVVTNNNLTISGSVTLAGTEGGAHSNADLTLSGNPTITQDATASGAYSTSGSPTIGVASGGGYGEMRLRAVNAENHLSKADFILDVDGTMTTTSNGMTVSCNPCAGAWVHNASGWVISGNDNPTGGTYYIEGGLAQGNATISGSPGSNATPARISIIAEGSIEISGNPILRPDAPGLLFVTNGDLKINGNPNTVGEEGQVLVHEQLMISGNPALLGQILVENAATDSTLVTSNTISGSGTITYNGTAPATFFAVTAWRRVP